MSFEITDYTYDPVRKLQTTKDDFSMEEKKMLKKMHKNNGKPYIQIE